MSTRTFRKHLALAFIGAASLLLPILTWADPPSRVARLSYLGGEVSFSPSGEDSWFDAQINRPLVVGDRLWTDSNGRVEMEMGTATLRVDYGSSIEFLNLDDQLAQVQVTQGVVNLRVDYLHDGQLYEIDTPTLAMVVSEPGQYRVDIAPDGDSSQVTVFNGRAEIYGENNASVAVLAGNSIRFLDPSLDDYRQMAIPSSDDFDRWVYARNDRLQNSPSRQYVSSEMIGYSDLDTHGSWRSVSDYGHVWFPRHVTPGWAPYRYGHWSWIDPWGWTWIDDAPWGFAPSHYGRWVYVSNGWGWIPGPRHMRPVYAPALVAFVGGSGWSLSIRGGGPPIGWFPLGPRDVYMPWYRVSRNYFGRVNVNNTVVVNNINVTNIYNDYYVQGRAPRRDYTFRNAVNAVTVVPQDAFTSSRRAADSLARLQPGSLQRGELLTRAPATPTAASLVSGNRASRPAPAGAARSVVARHEPAARLTSFENRRGAIARNGGEPLASDQLRRISAGTSNARTPVRLVGSGRGGETAARAGSAAATTRTPVAAGRGGLGSVSGRERLGSADTSRQTSAATRSNSRVNTPNQTMVVRGRGNNDGTATRDNSRTLPSSGYARGRTGNEPSGAATRAPASNASAGNRVSTPSAAARSGSTAPTRAIQPRNESSTGRAPVASRSQQSAPASRTAAPPRQQSATPSTRQRSSAASPPAQSRQRQSTQRSTIQRQHSVAPQQQRTLQAPTQRSVQPRQRSSAPTQQRALQAPARPSAQTRQRSVAPTPQRSQTTPPSQRAYQAPAQQQPRSAPAPQQQRSAPARRTRSNDGQSDTGSRRNERSR